MSPINIVPEANYDVVGEYAQDQINGFTPDTIKLMLAMARLESARSVLDCMAGDGNLTAHLAEFCEEQAIKRPETYLLEFSRIQLEFARARLRSLGTGCIWGDVLSYTNRETDQMLPEEMCDRLLVKSANHEIPLEKQKLLAENFFRLLEPEGLLINLGFLLDDRQQRDELAAFTRVKDRLAGMQMQVENRHFLLRDEYYTFLEAAGFEILTSQSITYRIESQVVAEQYFPQERFHEAHVEFQAAQLAARHMRAAGRLRFHETGSVMELPGEITVARRLPEKIRTRNVYTDYPYTLVKSMRCHRELREEIVAHISQGDRVLDLGCGPGFLAEQLDGLDVSYTGIDMSQEFIDFARKQNTGKKLFIPGDINERMQLGDPFDVVCLVNVLYQEAVNVQAVLSNAYSYLRPGGYICVAGPLRKESFLNIQDKIYSDLVAESVQFQKSDFDSVVEANQKLLRMKGNYWSAEGMVALLTQFGFSAFVFVGTDHYYGNSYLVVAQKPAAVDNGNN